MVDARQEYESAKAMDRQRKAGERDEQLKSFKGYTPVPKSPSDFHHHGINALRKMIENASPEAIETSGNHWRTAADRLAGEDGRGGIRKSFMDAVDHATAHWEGSAAEAFRKEAGTVLGKIDRTYGHARVVEGSLIGTREAGPEAGVAHSLREAKKAMSSIKDPNLAESALKGKGDDKQFHQDMANPKMDARMALELNRDSLSLSKVRQVEAVIVMDELAANYNGHTKIVKEGFDLHGSVGDWPKPPAAIPPPPPVNMPVTGGTRPRPAAVTPKKPQSVGGHAVPQGFGGLDAQRSGAPVHTGLDSLPGGTTSVQPPGGGGATTGAGTPPVGGHGGAGGTGGFPSGAIPPGAVGVPGGAMGSGRAGGTRGGAVGAVGAIRPGGGAQSGAPRGAAGKPGGPTGGAKQGGAGLHRSRGGSQAGTGGGARGTQGGQGAVGSQGVAGRRKGEKERGGKQRPDYLVEEEETWTPQRNVAPRVIE
ncbi:hypothetical protein [Streptomyces celluloflavus]|uniref:hypothetical protein n=1 Tax=Streptomyces celluloflavus TaxID=58344 RepID=UPI0034612998|nr:hypothetical protein OG717_24755 [Streptomyces celluloflavus]